MIILVEMIKTLALLTYEKHQTLLNITKLSHKMCLVKPQSNRSHFDMNFKVKCWISRSGGIHKLHYAIMVSGCSVEYNYCNLFKSR